MYHWQCQLTANCQIRKTANAFLYIGVFEYPFSKNANILRQVSRYILTSKVIFLSFFWHMISRLCLVLLNTFKCHMKLLELFHEWCTLDRGRRHKLNLRQFINLGQRKVRPLPVCQWVIEMYCLAACTICPGYVTRETSLLYHLITSNSSNHVRKENALHTQKSMVRCLCTSYYKIQTNILKRSFLHGKDILCQNG